MALREHLLIFYHLIQTFLNGLILFYEQQECLGYLVLLQLLQF